MKEKKNDNSLRCAWNYIIIGALRTTVLLQTGGGEAVPLENKK